MKRFAQIGTFAVAFFCTTQLVQAAGIDKADLALKYDLKKGKQIYDESCAACHNSGLLASPKFCDVAAWKPRMDKGMDMLIKHAIEGFNAMPSKGGVETLTIDESADAVAYMVEQCLF
jgi:cytochrome c5